MRFRFSKTKAPAARTTSPDNLLDLNRSLPNYVYHPIVKEDTNIARTEPPKKRKPWKKIMLWVLTILVVAGLASGGWVLWKLLANQIRIFGWGGVVDLFKDEKLRGEDEGRVNILVAGNSADDPGHGGANLTDSMMVLSIDTAHNRAFMVSIPRDLYVEIPDNGYAKINEAYQTGEREGFSAPGYPEGGMGLLSKTVSEHFGLPLHYYALVNYAAVRDAVDAVGGISVTITSDDPRGLYDPSPDYWNRAKPLVKLSNGAHTINGIQALGLARARGAAFGSYGYALSDFQRSENQRLILLGLKQKTVTASTLANPVKLGELFDAMGVNVQTDLSLGNARRLYGILKGLPDANITSVGLHDAGGENLLASYATRSGQSALVPRTGIDDYSEIQAYLHELMAPPPAPPAEAGQDASGR